MSLPTLLVFEVRAAFRCSARQHIATRRCPYSTSTRLLARIPPAKASTAARSTPSRLPARALQPTKTTSDLFPAESNPRLTSPSSSTELTNPPPKPSTSLDTDNKVTIPTKILPKPTLGLSTNNSKHQLSPMQRLHIEHLTRHPPVPKPTKPFAERLLVYNVSSYTQTALIFWRIFFLSGAAFMTCIWLPSYILHSSLPNYLVILIWLGSFVPAILYTRLTRSIITEAFLNLPTPASRASPQAAMNYAKNLPRDASMQVRFHRWTGITGMMRIHLNECQPLTKQQQQGSRRWGWWKFANFRVPMTESRRAESSIFKPALTEFFVYPTTAGGKRARDTVPGLWDIVYKRLTGVDASTVSRWHRITRR